MFTSNRFSVKVADRLLLSCKAMPASLYLGKQTRSLSFDNKQATKHRNNKGLLTGPFRSTLHVRDAVRHHVCGTSDALPEDRQDRAYMDGMGPRLKRSGCWSFVMISEKKYDISIVQRLGLWMRSCTCSIDNQYIDQSPILQTTTTISSLLIAGSILVLSPRIPHIPQDLSEFSLGRLVPL